MIELSNNERRRDYRMRMARLASFNGSERMANALRATQETLTGLHPMQPPDLEGLVAKLTAMDFNPGQPNGVIGEAVDTLTGSFQLDRRRSLQIISEWDGK